MLALRMQAEGQSRRRVLGVILLGTALLMVFAGDRVLQGRGPLLFVVYWSACLVLTVGAIVIAFRDARALRQATRAAQADLLDQAFKEISDKAKRSRQGGQNGTGPKETRGSVPPGSSGLQE